MRKTSNHHIITAQCHAASNKHIPLNEVQVGKAGGTTALSACTQHPCRGGGGRGGLGFLGGGLHFRGTSGSNDGLNVLVSL